MVHGFQKREIISLHVGQAGIQIANSMWELYCLEHLIDPDGYLVDHSEEDDSSYETFFERTNTMRFVPRAIFFDTENISIGKPEDRKEYLKSFHFR